MASCSSGRRSPLEVVTECRYSVCPSVRTPLKRHIGPRPTDRTTDRLTLRNKQTDNPAGHFTPTPMRAAGLVRRPALSATGPTTASNNSRETRDNFAQSFWSCAKSYYSNC
eukprot:Selendium_serpulae@DN6455_c0_g1_i7.p2